jgi:hypothetical protein
MILSVLEPLSKVYSPEVVPVPVFAETRLVVQGRFFQREVERWSPGPQLFHRVSHPAIHQQQQNGLHSLKIYH